MRLRVHPNRSTRTRARTPGDGISTLLPKSFTTPPLLLGVRATRGPHAPVARFPRQSPGRSRSGHAPGRAVGRDRAGGPGLLPDQPGRGCLPGRAGPRRGDAHPAHTARQSGQRSGPERRPVPDEPGQPDRPARRGRDRIPRGAKPRGRGELHAAVRPHGKHNARRVPARRFIWVLGSQFRDSELSRQ